MAENGISRLPTKEARLIAKLELAKSKRQNTGHTEYRPNNEYDVNLLPTQYSGNTVVYNSHPAGLVVGRPWTNTASLPSPIFYLNALDYQDGIPTWVDRSSDHRTINLSNVTYDGSDPTYPLVVFGTNKTGIDSAASTQIGNLTLFTVSVWLKINTLPSSIGDREILADNEQSWGFRLDFANGGLKLNFVKYGVADQYVTIPFSLTTGQFYNIVGAMDATETRYYIDGVKIGAFTNNQSKQTPAGGSTITINGKNSFDFSLFSAQIYDSPLSDAQVALLHTLI